MRTQRAGRLQVDGDAQHYEDTYAKKPQRLEQRFGPAA
jgi:hypothetical protein